MTREEIAARVDTLAAEHTGAEFAASVKRFAGELDDPGRAILAELLVARARQDAAEEYREVTEQMREERWRVFMPRSRRRPR